MAGSTRLSEINCNFRFDNKRINDEQTPDILTNIGFDKFSKISLKLLQYPKLNEIYQMEQNLSFEINYIKWDKISDIIHKLK